MYICISSTYYKHSNIYPISDWDEIGGEGGKGSPSSCLALQDYGSLLSVCVKRERGTWNGGNFDKIIITKHKIGDNRE